MIYYEQGGKNAELSDADIKSGLERLLEKLGQRKKILVIPPDATRSHSKAGEIVQMLWESCGDALSDILPALGTHDPMTAEEIDRMFGDVPKELFRNHDWRNEVRTIGHIDSSVIKEVSEGKLEFEWPAQVNRMLVEGNHDLILSVGQVVPHEVVGMANHHKNILIGTGGAETINLSHYLGAVYGMERMMGQVDTPVRKILNLAFDQFLSHLPIVYVLTVIGPDANSGDLVPRGLFIGDDNSVFDKAAQLSLNVNFTMLDDPLDKVIVYLPPDEFKTTWLGNKSIYRTRMAIADNGELVVIAPGLKKFGEDKEIDELIRKYGYCTTPEILDFVKNNKDLQNNLGAAAHLVHGSTEKRFKVTYCTKELTKAEVESVHYQHGDLKKYLSKYDITTLKDGFNTLPDGERIFYISNPALGLWAYKGRLT